MKLSCAIRRRLGKCSAQEIEAELRRMQKAYEAGKPFRRDVYGHLKRMLMDIDRIAMRNGGEARQDLHDFDDWCRRKAEREAAALNGSHVMGTSIKSNPKTFCVVVK
tara:strand:- start:335 stop:655 length:321 start_codon:yes stop_codon:yes gene_type:complete